ncbi:phosphonoacetaldehyde hydrolase-like [Rhopilema esculentum]|uniref:phosphonoacetaldehyde hydrolase-like n=1 Tax=Rhopilema esculentum TaxID=499914 RepID=UPI0031DFA05D|eukprot:gene13964-4924_t
MPSTIKLVIFDLAGTTVDDNINGLPLVTVAIQEAFAKAGFPAVKPDLVNDVRGMEKREAIASLLRKLNINKEEKLIDKIFADFKLALDRNLNSINQEIPGTTDVFKKLKELGILIGVGSGFPHAVVVKIVQNLKWESYVDFVSSAEKEGHGRPHPHLIQSAMRDFNVTESKEVVKVGDTRIDIQEGKNAGCWTVAVLTGTQKRSNLMEENPDFIIDSIVDIFAVIKQISKSSH